MCALLVFFFFFVSFARRSRTVTAFKTDSIRGSYRVKTVARTRFRNNCFPTAAVRSPWTRAAHGTAVQTRYNTRARVRGVNGGGESPQSSVEILGRFLPTGVVRTERPRPNNADGNAPRRASLFPSAHTRLAVLSPSQPPSCTHNFFFWFVSQHTLLKKQPSYHVSSCTG